jgi:hypothetical protein
MSLFKALFGGTDYHKVENSQRFNFMLQQMQQNRWKITLLVMFTFFFIVFGIVLAVMVKATIQESWKELLLILLGAFVGNLNKVIDFWFSNEDRDKLLVQKMDEEDDAPGTGKYNILEHTPNSPKPSGPTNSPTAPATAQEPYAEEPQAYVEPEATNSDDLADPDNYRDPEA